jgi:hypothetical protein
MQVAEVKAEAAAVAAAVGLVKVSGIVVNKDSKLEKSNVVGKLSRSKVTPRTSLGTLRNTGGL